MTLLRWITSGVLAAAALSGQPLTGVIDIHAHSDPDVVPRSIDAIDLARLAKERGMRGLVLKSHYEPTATLAAAVRKAVPGIEIFGGIDLNRSVGGLNPAAVERMADIKGRWGRVIWLPTFDAENQVRFSKENRPFVPVTKNGSVLPEVKEVIALAVKHRLMLETGHSSAAEALLIIREARAQGLTNIVVTHAMLAPVRMTIPQMQEAAKAGAYLEFVYNALIGPNKEFEMADYVRGHPGGGRAVLHPGERPWAGWESSAPGRFVGIFRRAAARRNLAGGYRPHVENQSRTSLGQDSISIGETL